MGRRLERPIRALHPVARTRVRKNLLFLKKKKQKDFIHLHPRLPGKTGANGQKFFWFFFQKRTPFFFPHDPPANPDHPAHAPTCNATRPRQSSPCPATDWHPRRPPNAHHQSKKESGHRGTEAQRSKTREAVSMSPAPLPSPRPPLPSVPPCRIPCFLRSSFFASPLRLLHVLCASAVNLPS